MTAAPTPALPLDLAPLRFAEANAVLYPRALPDAEDLLQTLRAELDWTQEILTLYGRRIPQPRMSAWYGDAAYAYSGILMQPRPWPPVLADLRRRCEDMAAAPFNSVLANLYRDGRDSMDWHSDDEASLGREPVIASVNLGARRRFQLRRKSARDEKIEMELGEGDVLIMAGRCQHDWQHRVPKTKKPTGPRINLTFRLVVDEPQRP